MPQATAIISKVADAGVEMVRESTNDLSWWAVVRSAPPGGTVCPQVNVRGLSPSDIEMLERAIARPRIRE